MRNHNKTHTFLCGGLYPNHLCMCFITRMGGLSMYFFGDSIFLIYTTYKITQKHIYA